ncbi:BTB/POZ and MATH domain-containing protein 2-like [Triticum urartu]|uniref:BTB/POZ and MATH domain-containing protein 2-like n=1 Tax=Triticum urartu TaxID=4572 RepID=UPI0020438C93|nr:BTB/POZ and MATH domain-containing protein 2-like [Triticum urartu]
MSTSGLLSAMRGAGRQHITVSTLRTAPAAGSHVFRIEEFTRLREKTANGVAVLSSPFAVGGHEWRIRCFPNGRIKDSVGHVSLHLQHDSHAKTGDVTATYKMSILDKSWEPSCTQIMENHRFETDDGYWGWRKFMKHKDLDLDREKYLKDDCLSVLCDVTVDDEVAAPEQLNPEPAPMEPPHGLHLAEAADVMIHLGDGQRIGAHRFIYTDSPPAQLEEAPATTVEQLLMAADRYELKKLRAACEEALCKKIDVSSVATALALDERYGCPALRKACMRVLSSPDNLEAVAASSDGLEKLKTLSLSVLLDLFDKNMPLREQQRMLRTNRLVSDQSDKGW